MTTDTIAAIATAPGAGGIGIIRVSGPDALPILEKLFAPAGKGGYKPWTLRRGRVQDMEGNTLDDALAVFMPGPKTFTGEDVAEFQCHGGPVLLAAVLEACLCAGARLAERGEFTRRAFLNGKLGLTQAEAVMDLIRAIRARRAEMNVPPSKKAELMIVTDQAEPYQQGLHFIQRLAYASNVTFPETAPADVTGLVSVVTHDATAYLPLSELVDLAAERERIAKELEKAKNGLRITEGKLANEKFVAHAPENVVNAEREKVAKYQELIAKLEESAKAMA